MNKKVAIFFFYLFIAWVVNLIQFLNCDFSNPWNDEILHGIGLFGLSFITCWL